MRRARAFVIAVLSIVLLSIALLPVGPVAAEPLGAVIPYSADEIVNPLRGQHDDLLNDLLPQANPNLGDYPAWPGTADASNRYTWKQLQPAANTFDFSVIDRDIAAAAAQGRRFGFRVMAFNSFEAPVGGVISAVPEWLRGMSGATADRTVDGTTYVVPDWDNNTYLTKFTTLVQRLGSRYDRDERLAWFEHSGYGDFSENHVFFMKDRLGLPGPAPENSVAELGYYSQYADQDITLASVKRLTDANLQAFRRTQVVLAPGNPAIVRRALLDSPKLAGRAKPVGIRSDCLGTYAPIPTWATDPWSYYVLYRSDPATGYDQLLSAVEQRWRTAPILTEWCNFTSGRTDVEFHRKALTDTVNYHVSVTSSAAPPWQWGTTPLAPEVYDLFARTNKYAGYRYAVTAAATEDQVLASTSSSLRVTWTNVGSAPAYENWRPEYEIRDAAGRVVATVPARVNPRELVAEQGTTDTAAEPAAASIDDSVTLSTEKLPAGDYHLYVRVVWNEHKSAGVHKVNVDPMNLAQRGRDSGGAYPIGGFTVRSPGPSAVEAENAVVTPATAGRVVADGARSGRKVLRLNTDGGFSVPMNLIDATRIGGVFAGKSCAGAPEITVRIDGTALSPAPTALTATAASTYWWDLPAPTSGTHTVSVEFANDYRTSAACDRTVFADLLTAM